MALAARYARRLPASKAGVDAISLAEDYVQGREVDHRQASRAAEVALAAGDAIAASAVRAARAAGTRGPYPSFPAARAKAFSIVAEVLSRVNTAEQITAIRTDYEVLLAAHKSAFPGFGHAIDLASLHADRVGFLIQAEVVVLGREVDAGRLVDLVAFPWFEIVRELKNDADLLLKLPWRKMEELVAAAYTRSGCPEVILTPRSNDDGRDVIATWPGIGSIRIIDQVKRYSPGHLVTADDVRAMLGTLAADRNVSKGVITTTSSFAPGINTNEKFTAFMPHRLELKDGKTVAAWLDQLADT